MGGDCSQKSIIDVARWYRHVEIRETTSKKSSRTLALCSFCTYPWYGPISDCRLIHDLRPKYHSTPNIPKGSQKGQPSSGVVRHPWSCLRTGQDVKSHCLHWRLCFLASVCPNHQGAHVLPKGKLQANLYGNCSKHRSWKLQSAKISTSLTADSGCLILNGLWCLPTDAHPRIRRLVFTTKLLRMFPRNQTLPVHPWSNHNSDILQMFLLEYQVRQIWNSAYSMTCGSYKRSKQIRRISGCKILQQKPNKHQNHKASQGSSYSKALGVAVHLITPSARRVGQCPGPHKLLVISSQEIGLCNDLNIFKQHVVSPQTYGRFTLQDVPI